MKQSITRWALIAVLLGSMMSIAQSQSGLPINVAASVNGSMISNDMVEQGILAALAQGQKESPDLRNIVISKLIDISLLSQQAEKDGLANSEKANRQLAFIRQNYLADLELSTFITQNPVTDSDIQNEYNRQIASLGTQGLIVEYKVSDIAVATQADAQAALARIKKGESFDKVARSVSLAQNKVQGGAVGWVQAEQVLPEIAQVLPTLNNGQTTSTPIQMQQGWYLVKLEDKKLTKPPTFEQAKPAIRSSLIQKKQFEFLSQLRQTANIVVQ